MPPIQYIVEGGHRLAGTIEPSGNKNSALPITAAALLTEHPVTLENVPRIRDTETLVELIRSVGASAEWTARNTLAIHANGDVHPCMSWTRAPVGNLAHQSFEAIWRGEELGSDAITQQSTSEAHRVI